MIASYYTDMHQGLGILLFGAGVVGSLLAGVAFDIHRARYIPRHRRS